MRFFGGKICRENQNTLLCPIFLKNCAVYEIIVEKYGKPDRPQLRAYCGEETIQFA
jgi:hypothetical protein